MGDIDDFDWGNEKLQRAQKTVNETPYDLEAWALLIREAQNRPIAEVRPVFEKLISVFPSAGRYWKIYIEQELFQRCLIKILNIELWKLYLTYVKETKASLTTYKEKMAQAYDFALDKIGMDIHSYSIWNDYIVFLKSVEAVGSYAENQRISAVRKVYQRGVVNPMINMEQLWKDYMAFEQNINPIIAEKMAVERSRDYMNARRVAKELEAATRGLNRNAPSVPPTGHPDEIKQVELWKKYISWEKGNPLRTEDTSLVARRVMFAIDQCLLCLGHHPAVWHQAAHFLEQSSKILTEKGDVNGAKNLSDEAASMFERATNTLLSKNMLLYFAHADFEEGRIKYEKVHQIYQKFLDMPDIDPTLAYVQYMKFARRAEGIKSARTVFKRAREDSRCKHHIYVAAALMEYYCTKDKNIAFRIFELGLKKFGDNPDYILCYIDYLSHLNGGSFPLPPSAAQLCTILPPPDCFRGPFVAVDMLMDVFSRIQLPEHAPAPVADNGCETKLFDLAKSVHWIVDEVAEGNSLPNKRKRLRINGEESEEEDLPPPPANDIYRLRQQKRVK
ncbi:unnamed protein product [Trichogramma brassicae]|uniref:Suppressor of forked domain-containing protein n=1 Tax=Trichogramma brassicae TaxID=86971 RepID=A0A6H5I4M6_9HYME|nr:unnamed protein product [Trichogramma brassicae]